MKLYYKGHDYKYAAEQIMFALFPDERPEYISGEPKDGDSFALISLSRGKTFTTAFVKLSCKGEFSTGSARCKNTLLTDKISLQREHQKIIKLAFYRAALPMLPEKPVWGALTGIRPGTLMTRLAEEGLSYQKAAKKMQKLYFISPERAELLKDTVKATLKVKGGLNKNDAAIYVGIPFCPTRCAYCSFVSQSIEKSIKLIPPFLEALYREIDATAETAAKLGLNIIAVYFGGGTPTTLSANQLQSVIERLKAGFDFKNVTEFCVEAGRPDTITEDRLRVLKEAGVTRISINPQTMSDEVLSAIGRRHSAENIRKAYELSRKVGGFQINMDLIAGLPTDTAEGFEKTLREVLAMEPENITVHTLALKRGSDITLEGTKRPGKTEVSKMLDLAMELLYGGGFSPYYLYRQKFMSGGFENIGWSKTGCESLYNIVIMEELRSILAMGGGASTKLVDPEKGRIERIFDPKYPLEYINSIDKTIEDKRKIEKFYLG